MAHWSKDGESERFDVGRVLSFLVPGARGGDLLVVARGRQRLSRLVTIAAERRYEIRSGRLFIVATVHPTCHGVGCDGGGRRTRRGRHRSGLEREERIYGYLLFLGLGYVWPADEGSEAKTR